jgi:cytoskeletal protein RodZ
VYKVEKEPVESEEEKEEESSENGRGKMNEWFVENLRMIVSVVIVLVIAGGIYSYSKRAQAPNMSKTASTEENSEGKISVIGGDNQEASDNQQAAPESTDQQQTQPSENVQAAPQPQTSQETGTSFVETAAKGDGSTKLARRALANYLEKNPDSSLTAEHKIYIEDILRRQVSDGHLKIGDKREFSKDMIANAIEKSKSLNNNQLKNLQKYAQRVPELK